jgi:hypothetical protein
MMIGPKKSIIEQILFKNTYTRFTPIYIIINNNQIAGTSSVKNI